MRERRVFMLLGIVLAVFVLGLAYASISTQLEITGNATGTFDPSNFQVKFSKVSAVTGTKGVNTSGSTATIDSSDPTKGSFSFTGFTTKGQTQSATWTISNENDAELSAYLETITESEINREYFRATCDLADNVLAANETTTVTIAVECIKTPDVETVDGGEFIFSFTATSSADEIVDDGGSSGGGSGTTPTETLPTTTDYVGCYADMDRDGTVDGVIFADLGYGQVGDGEWGDNGYGTYTIPKIESGLKEYYISQESYTITSEDGAWDSEAHPVISPVEGTSGEDRFYVMKLSDFTTSSYSKFYWYYSAYSEASLDDAIGTSEQDFGEGYTKTGEVIAKWNLGEVSNGGYGAQNDQDIWKHIQSEYANGWFIPSKGEWSAFGGELGITSSNYSSTYGLSGARWSSTQRGTYTAYIAGFEGDGTVYDSIVSQYFHVRLCATF